jgi:hypothetical protein
MISGKEKMKGTHINDSVNFNYATLLALLPLFLLLSFSSSTNHTLY